MFSVYAGNAQSSCPVVGAVTGCSTHARLRHWNFDPRNCCASVDWSMSEHSATDAAPVWWGNSDGSQWPDVRQRSGSTQPHNPAKMVQVLGLLKIRLRQLHWLPVHLKRNFKYLQLSSFIFLYKNMVRSNLDYCSSVWTPYRKGDIEDLEKVQKRAVGIYAGINSNKGILTFDTCQSKLLRDRRSKAMARGVPGLPASFQSTWYYSASL